MYDDPPDRGPLSEVWLVQAPFFFWTLSFGRLLVWRHLLIRTQCLATKGQRLLVARLRRVICVDRWRYIFFRTFHVMTKSCPSTRVLTCVTCDYTVKLPLWPKPRFSKTLGGGVPQLWLAIGPGWGTEKRQTNFGIFSKILDVKTQKPLKKMSFRVNFEPFFKNSHPPPLS